MGRARLKVDIRGLRREAGVGQVKAASLMDVAPMTLDRIEAGQAPNLVTALKIARFMQMAVEEIWGIE